MIGIFGGTFDPIHLGHLRTVLDVQEVLGLETVRFIPSAAPPHRDTPDVSAEQRAAMTRLAIEGQTGFVYDGRELERDGRSYTVLTLESLRKELGGKQPMCLIVGTDAFLGFPSWHRWEELLLLCNVAVMVRPGYHLDPAAFPTGWLSQHLRDAHDWNSTESAGQVVEVPVTQLEISATDIRQRLAAGRNIRYLVPEPVRHYILEQGLYNQL